FPYTTLFRSQLPVPLGAEDMVVEYAGVGFPAAQPGEQVGVIDSQGRRGSHRDTGASAIRSSQKGRTELRQIWGGAGALCRRGRCWWNKVHTGSPQVKALKAQPTQVACPPH